MFHVLLLKEKKNCYHGNIHCDNLIVEKFDDQKLVVKFTDPGMVNVYNKLPLEHSVNQRR